ncbi:MAG TPA: DUF1059 domain-containing protein [Vicinamibacteria bacterium]|nr:DUF1059 domain-containing protein [Vicinamibacteria bacterium]
MSKHIACGDLVEGCSWKADAPTEDELVQKVAAHASSAHGVKQVTPELAANVKSAIREL